MLSKCLKIVGAFTPAEIDELERHAAEVAGGGKPQNHHYLVAAERILAGLKAQSNAAAPADVRADDAAAPRLAGSPEVEQADIAEIEDALKRYNSEPDTKRALEHLRWVADEADQNESTKVRDYARRRLDEEAAPADLKQLVNERATDGAHGPGTLDVPKVATHSSLPPGARMVERMTSLKVGEEPAAVGMNELFNTHGVDLSARALEEHEADAVRAAAWNLYQGKARVFSMMALRSLRAIITGEPQQVAPMDALYLGGRNTIWFNARGSLGRAANTDNPAHAANLAVTLAHELVHAADGHDGTYASARDTSPTMGRLEADEEGMYLDANPVLQEALLAYARDRDGLARLRYPLGALSSAGAELAGKHPAELSSEQIDQAEIAIEHAATELPAVLMEYFVAEPQTLKRAMPKAYDYISRLASAGTLQEARTILGGKPDAGRSQPVGQAQRNGAGVRASVREDAGAQPPAKPGRVRAAAEAVDQAGQGGAGPEGGAAVGGRDEGGLTPPPPEFKSPLARGFAELLGGWQNKPQLLGWLTNRQLADRFGDVPGMKALSEFIGKMSTKAKGLMQESHLIDQAWAKLPAAEATEMQKLMLESTLERMHVDRPLAHSTNQHLSVTDPATHEKHKRLASRFEALSPAAKKVFRDTEAKFRKDWIERAHLLKSRIVDQYKPELGALATSAEAVPPTRRTQWMIDNKTTRAQSKALRSLWLDLDAHAHETGRVQGPYFPLVRFGQHVVVAKSPKFLAAQSAFKAATEHLQKLNAADDTTAEDLDAARQDVAKTRDAVAALKDNQADYIVEFYEHRTEAEDRRKQLAAFLESKGLTGMEVYRQVREQHFAQLDSVSPAFMNRLEETLKTGLPDKDAAEIRAAVRDLYIQSMPERSALKAQLNRMNVRGAKVEEMRRAFAASSMRNAWHLSRLEFNLPMHESLTTLRTGESDESKLLGAEMAKRFVQSMTYDEPNQLISALSQVSYFSYLGLSPSFFLLNATQPWVISLPIMGARFGMGAPTRELGHAFREVAAALKSSAKDQKTWRFELDMTKFKDADERRMLGELFDKGIIDITIEHDLGAVASGEVQTKFGKLMQMAALPAHHTEVLNRVMTALAAYRLEKRNNAQRGITGADGERRATAYAEKVVAETHLDYTPENAPRLMRSSALGGLGRLVFQFKKYTQGMIYLVAKNMVDATRGDKEARRAVAYLMGMMLGVAGTSGLPIAAPLGLVFKALSKLWDDDEEPEISQVLYNGLKAAVGEQLARTLVKGLPAGVLNVDLSNRVGMGQLLDPFGLTRESNKEGKEWVAEKLLALAGPAASLAANYADAAVLAGQDPMKAAQAAMPRFLADPLRALDRADRGITSRTGQQLIAPEELGLPADVLRALGFESTTVTDMYDTRAAFAEMKQNKSDVRKQLIASFVHARHGNGDMVSVREEVQAFNSRNPSDRITAGQLEQAVRRERQAQREMKNGVRVGKRDADVAEKLGLND